MGVSEVFINLSNHPSSKWDESQYNAAIEYGDIVDLPFPIVPADADEAEVDNLARNTVDDVSRLCSGQENVVIMAQGEFTLTYSLITKLKSCGYRVVSACTERDVTERVDETGNKIKESRFKFVRFREYR